MTQKQQQAECGCKGVRYCAVCEKTERVKKINFSNKTFENYKVFVYDPLKNIAIHSQNLSTNASLEEIKNAIGSSCFKSAESFSIDGLTLIHNFLTNAEEIEILEMIDSVEWVNSQSGRRKQDYGPKVNFKHKKVKMDTFKGMPEYADMLLEKMKKCDANKLGSYLPFEMCNLEYEESKKSAIEMHQDDTWIWGNRLISINLINGSIMTLTNDDTKQLCYVFMPHRSLICMADDARYKWKHGVFAHHIRGRRIALTMREPSMIFQEGGELHEKFGAELIRIGTNRVILKKRES